MQVCGTTPCMLRGAEALVEVCRRRIHHDPHQLSADGDFSWEEVECLGCLRQCADGADLQGYLRGSDAGAVREGAGRLRQPATRQSPARRSAGRRRVRQAGRRRSKTWPRRGKVEERSVVAATGQGSHLPQCLRLPGLEAGRRQGARRLGRHQGADRQGPRLDHQRGQEIGPARPRRRGIPDRPQVVVHAQERSRAQLPRDQCRRVGARLLQGSRDHAPRSAPVDRGRVAGVVRDAGAHLLHLRARRVHPRARASGGGRRGGLRRPS